MAIFLENRLHPTPGALLLKLRKNRRFVVILLSYLFEIKFLFWHRPPAPQELLQDLVLRDRRWVVTFFLIARNELKLLFFWKIDRIQHRGHCCSNWEKTAGTLCFFSLICSKLSPCFGIDFQYRRSRGRT